MLYTSYDCCACLFAPLTEQSSLLSVPKLWLLLLLLVEVVVVLRTPLWHQ